MWTSQELEVAADITNSLFQELHAYPDVPMDLVLIGISQLYALALMMSHKDHEAWLEGTSNMVDALHAEMARKTELETGVN